MKHATSLLASLVLAIALPVAAPAQPAAVQQPGSLLIWPVTPAIEGDARAAALWLENPGKAPITLQVRIYAWAQQDGRNVYAEQDEILGTPPIISIQPGQRQLIRLTRTGAPPAVPEKTYRVVVDEIPAAETSTTPGAAVSFRMRYSLPLFSYAAGGKAKGAAPLPAPALSWRVGEDGDGRFLEVRNGGAGHARLTEAAFSGGARKVSMSEGLLGYVLPGAIMRWPLPAGVEVRDEFVVAVNGAPAARVERRAE